MGVKSEKIQAAVYLIDDALFGNYDFDETVRTIITQINSGTQPQFRYRPDELSSLDSNDFQLSLYYNYKQMPPKWSSFLKTVLGEAAVLNSAENRVYSFICFIGYQEHIFAVAGGSGSLAIDRFVVQDFGMELITRLFHRHHKVVKSIQDRGVTGAVLGQTKFYRGDQRFSDENEFGKIYKQVQAELSNRILTENFGFKEEELKRKVSGCLAKSSFQISKAIDFPTLLRLVRRFTEILGFAQNFALNKVSHISKRQKKNHALINQLNERLVNVLFDDCVNEVESDFDFCHKEFDKYRIASVFTLKLPDNETIEFEEPVHLGILVEQLRKEERLLLDDSTFFKHSVLELFIEAADNDGNILTNGKVLEHLHGEVNLGEKVYFIIDGEWYEIHPDFIQDINRECKDILEQCWDCELVKEVFHPKQKERDFNSKFIGQANTFVFDTITPENIEACDILKHDDQSVYLLHVKKGFNNSIRDLAAQIAIAARRIKQDKLSGYNYISELEKQAGGAIFSTSAFMKKIGKQKFPKEGLKKIFEGKRDKNIVFCLAFVDVAKGKRCLKANLDLFDSNIAKYALIELRRQIQGYGFDFKIIQLQKELVK